jgi:hypothetical protein
MRRVSALTAAVAIMMLLIGAPAPAHAGNGDWYRLVSIGYPGLCLDSNFAGDVYLLDCSLNANNHQRWQMWFGGFTKNVATGNCLTLKPGGTLRAERCDPAQRNVDQFWQQWDGGFVRNPNTDFCVSATRSFNPPVIWPSASRCIHTVVDQWWDQASF